MDYKCKCGNTTKFFTETKGSNIGLYCKECGKWIKWLNKDEDRLFNLKQGFKQELNKVDLEKPFDDCTKDYKSLIEKLIKNINYEVEREFDKEPISTEDAIRKSAYTYGLDKVRLSLENMINGD